MTPQPTTRPETWVPAGAEGKGVAGTGPQSTATAPPTSQALARRRPVVTLPPSEALKHPPRLRRARARLSRFAWIALAVAIPWAWFLVRDLASPMQLVELALPVIVAAAFLGLLISAIDSRKVGPLFVAASVAAFGWVTIIGPRSAQPSPRPVNPVRIAAVTMPATGRVATTLKALGAPKADVEIVVTPTKKAGAAVMRTHTSSVAFQSARFVVLSRFPAHELPLPKALPSDLVLRFQVDAPTGAFVVYAVRTGAGVLESSMNDPLRLDRLQAAALHERLPVILVGDAGIGDRSTEYRTLSTSFRDALRAGTSASSTLRSAIWTPLLLRVDHLFTSRSWCAAGAGTFDVPGSDHRGVVAAVGPCPR